MMRARVTPYTLTTAKNSTGGTGDTWMALSPVWGTLTRSGEARRTGAARYEYPATHALTVDTESWTVGGSRVVIKTVTYDVLGGTDTLDWQTVLDLREVTR